MSKDTVKLACGHQMPLLRFGLWKVPKESAADTGIKRAISECVVKREDISITTKLWNNYHAKEHALPMIKAQNESWVFGYIDLLLIPFPSALGKALPRVVSVKPAKVSNQETWKSLKAAVEQGIARSIGVSNFQGQSIYDLFTYNKHPPVIAYSSFGPQSILELPPAFRERAEGLPSLFDIEIIKKIASKHVKTPSQILLRFATQRNIAVSPKSNNKDGLAQTLDITSFYLSKEDIDSILALGQGLSPPNTARSDLQRRAVRSEIWCCS
ncbi:Aldo/keto reductase [Macroventuria anomochaeta]|uniref:Aldo/keto reductase n=1 Tax=Macroventuria anomochaeta TaxID=301207 RepID=A0ACB6RII5_9PLEO|nr:Aldo/keto reductase [Macroventuria anomochaeta]KAF2621497.1 Aldo/keto reductase [Macroventuria anomochaeta]